MKHSGRIQLEIRFVDTQSAQVLASDVWWEHGWLIYKEHGSGTGAFVAVPAEKIQRVETRTPPL